MEPQCIIQPRRLIDFLQDQNLPFPHLRSRKSTISSIIHAAVKSSIILRRRFSNKNRSSHSKEPTMARSKSVTVKDILRWKSFRDLSEPVEKNVPLSYDFTLESPTTRSSSSHSDFSVGDSPLWCRGSSLHINPKGKIVIQHEEEDEQFSPVSVLDFTQEVDLIGRNLMLKQQRVQDFQSLIEVQDHRLVNKNVGLDDVESFKIEEKAIQLMNRVKITSSVKECDEYMLLDFFRDELISNKGMKNKESFDSRVLRVAKSWVRGGDEGSLEWELEGTRKVCIREMEGRGTWNDFEDEKQAIGIKFEKLVLNNLLDELTMDLLKIQKA